MKHVTKARTATVAIAIAGALVMASGVAYAYWTASGSGSSTAKAVTAHSVVVSGVAGAADLYPGAAGAVSFTLNNAVVGTTAGNPYGITFDKVTAITVNSATGGCATSSVVSNVTLPYTLSPTITVNGNATSGTQTIPALVKMITGALDNCQGSTFDISITLTGSQV